MKRTLPYPDYRAWWITDVLGLTVRIDDETVSRPEPSLYDDEDPELG